MSDVDVKTWRRSVMSDEEAQRLWDFSSASNAVAFVLDQFVRRLGEMESGHSAFGWGFHRLPCSESMCRPAVLFVQPEKAKPLSDAEKIAKLTGIYASVFHSHADDDPPCLICDIGRVLRGERK